MKKIIIGFLSLILCSTSVAYASDGSLGNILTPEQVEEVQSVIPMTPGEVLREVGVIQGDSNGNLNPQDPITREELIAILVRVVPEGTEDFAGPQNPTFTDVPESHWAYKYVEQAYFLGLTSGLGDSSFGLGQYVSYKQAVTFIMKVIDEPVNWDTAVKDADKKYIFSENGKLHPEQIQRDDMFELVIRALTYSGIGTEKTPLYVDSKYTDMDALKLARYVGEKKYWETRPLEIEGLNDETSWLYELTGPHKGNIRGFIDEYIPVDIQSSSKVLDFYGYRDLATRVEQKPASTMSFKYTANIALSNDEIYHETHYIKLRQGHIVDTVEWNGERWEYDYNNFYGGRVYANQTPDGRFTFIRANRRDVITPGPEWYNYRGLDTVVLIEMSEDGSELVRALLAQTNPDHIVQIYELERVE